MHTRSKKATKSVCLAVSVGQCFLMLFILLMIHLHGGVQLVETNGAFLVIEIATFSMLFVLSAFSAFDEIRSFLYPIEQKD